MYSMNGRIKGETASKKNKRKSRLVVTCKECGFVLKDISKEFGEEMFCPYCGKNTLTYTLNDEK